MTLIFATSDKGGTGRSVTSCNMMYRRALQGDNVCYLDFDFGSPTAGAVFEVSSAMTGIVGNGLHSYLQGRVVEPKRLDLWTTSDRSALRTRPVGSGALTLLPGDRGGGEFALTKDVTRRCTELFLRLEEEFDICLVDLSAGRSFAVDLALEVSGQQALSEITCRWLIFHRWTRQHIVAANGLAFGDRGILKTAKAYGHEEDRLRDSIRFVRTAVLEPDSTLLTTISPAKSAWLRECNRDLQEWASRHELGLSNVLGQTPFDPMLQWREQLISDGDVYTTRIAAEETATAFDELAKCLTDDSAWEGL
ncbi:MAG: SCO2523 family variant P-loop protein [Actinophytocola sp.]|uniref:SCO2523 family variant P-loop protein n=1 Tax=Actinophytocola sp. TaxID=1872138 RepID=UPI003C755100